MNETKVRELACKMLDEMYQESTPSITWKELTKRYKGTNEKYYWKHHLPKEKMEKIKEKYLKLVGKRWKRELTWVFCDFSPIDTETFIQRKDLQDNNRKEKEGGKK